MRVTFELWKLFMNDLKLILPFLDKVHCERIIYLSEAKNGRNKVLSEFYHKFRNKFNQRYMTHVDVDTETIYNLLISRGAPDSCYVISNDEQVDGKTLLLKDALGEIRSETGSFILCVPNKLAYFESEEIHDRWILEIS